MRDMKKQRTPDEIAYDLWKSIQYEDSSAGKARKCVNEEERRARCKKLGDKNVESGHMKKIAPLGGKTVTPKKLEKILELNKTKRELTDEQVLEMKELYKNDISIGLPELAEKYSVCKVTIMNTLTGKCYSDVGEHLKLRQPLIKCPYCKDPQTKGNYTRWHGEKCKKNPNKK